MKACFCVADPSLPAGRQGVRKLISAYNAQVKRAIAFVVFGFAVLAIVRGALLHPDTSLVSEVSGAPQDIPSATPATDTSLSATSTAYEWYPVVQVVDGDTVVADIDGKRTTIRLIGLDTPETVDPRKPVQCFGKEASAKAKQILSGSSIRLETDPSQDTYDKYGRTLAFVFLKDGTLFNKYMIAEGYGHEYTYNLPYKYQTEFKAAEKAAREGKKGLWAPDVCMSGAEQRRPNADDGRTGTHIPSSGTYECAKNVYNCSSFTSQSEAQSVFESCGGAASDVHKLDSDGDRRVCESLP